MKMFSMTTAIISNDTFPSQSYVFTVIRSMGLCVPLSDYLAWVLNLNAIMQIVVSVVGMVGAAMSLRVSSLRQNRSSLSVQVSLLSLYDLLFLMAVLLLAILHLCDVADSTATDFLDTLRHLGLWGATYTMVDITIERCLSIGRPFLARKICSVGFTLKRAAVILVIGVLVTVPFVVDLVCNLSTKRDCNEQRTLTTFGVVYTLYLSILFFNTIPFICIFVANVRLIFALLDIGKDSRIAASCTSQNDSSAKQLALFVVGMCVWYAVCMFCPSILFLVRLSRAEIFKPEVDIMAAVSADSLIVLSAAANFVFYFLMWKNFRQTFLRMFCSRWHSGSLTLDSGEGRIHITSSSDHIILHSSAHGTSDNDNTCKG